TKYVYDALLRRTEVIENSNDPDLHERRDTVTTLDALGNVLSVDRDGVVTTYLYDDLFRKVATIEPVTPQLSRLTIYAYQVASDNLISETAGKYIVPGPDPLNAPAQPGSHVVTIGYQYDLLGRQTSVTDGQGGSTSLGYDNNDNLVSSANPLGV